jgi:hypothetical protein
MKSIKSQNFSESNQDHNIICKSPIQKENRIFLVLKMLKRASIRNTQERCEVCFNKLKDSTEKEKLFFFYLTNILILKISKSATCSM